MKQRIITAILALIVFVPILVYGKLPFVILTYLLATIGLLELLRMRKIVVFSIPTLLSLLAMWFILIPNTVPHVWNKADIMMLFVIVILAYTVLVKNKFTFNDAGFVLLSMVYVAMGFYFFMETRLEGLATVFFVLFIIWATDTGAYFTGRAMGKRKLWPDISPNKTIEGALGGIVFGCLVGIIFHWIHPFSHSTFTVIGVSILVSIAGQIGDLVESAFKRHFNVKDSGNILPGHGGILDRMDSLLYVFPILHLIHFIS